MPPRDAPKSLARLARRVITRHRRAAPKRFANASSLSKLREHKTAVFRRLLDRWTPILFERELKVFGGANGLESEEARIPQCCRGVGCTARGRPEDMERTDRHFDREEGLKRGPKHRARGSLVLSTGHRLPCWPDDVEVSDCEHGCGLQVASHEI